MRSAHGLRLVVLCCLATSAPGNILWAQTSSGQSGQSTAPKAAPKKTPSKPIDPDETGGVRGSGTPLTVHVIMRGKAVENAHVTVKNANGTLAGSCFTNASGDCKVDVGPDDYEIDAAGNGRTGTLKVHVSEKTNAVSIKLLKSTSAPVAAKP